MIQCSPGEIVVSHGQSIDKFKGSFQIRGGQLEMSGEILMLFELGVQIQDGQARKDIELF